MSDIVRFDVDAIRARYDLVAEARKDVTLTEYNYGGHHYYYGACPWCGGDDRFKVFCNDGGLYYYCRQCERSGDVIEYVIEKRNMPGDEGERFVDAVKWLESNQVTESPKTIPQNGTERALSGDSLVNWQNRLNIYADTALGYLLRADDGPARGALSWLEGRGITPAEVARFGIGYNNQWREIIPGYKLPPGIMIPRYHPESILITSVNVYLDKSARELTGHRRMFVKGSNPKATMFNEWRIAHDIRTVIIVEGELDAVLLGRFLPPVANDYIPVATGGADMHPVNVDSLRDKRVIVIPDNDPAGRKFAAKWRETLPDVILAKIPKKHKDITEYWKGGDDLAQWLQGIL